MRPEYLPFGLLMAAIALFRARLVDGGWRPGLAAAALLVAAFLLPIVPWTVRNLIVLDRFVPISTGGGKALYIGTYMPADGDGPRLRDQLLQSDPGLRRRLAGRPKSTQLDAVLKVLAARRHPELSTDQALGRMGRENLGDDLSDLPGFTAMLGRKAYRTWREGPRKVMHSTFWKAFQKLLALLALLGLGVLALRRRWEALPLALLAVEVTATGALLIASPRRVVVILPAVAALAGAGVAWLAGRLERIRATP
jgi:hypothetical protein